MTTQTEPFRLTDAMIARGYITDEEMTTFSGVKAVSISIDTLPSWKAHEEDRALTREEERESKEELLRFFQKNNLGRPSPPETTLSVAQQLLLCEGESLFSYRIYPCDAPRAPIFADRFLKRGKSINEALNPAKKVLMKGEPSRRFALIKAASPNERVEANKLVLYTRIEKESLPHFCRTKLQQPQEKIINAPDVHGQTLATDIHEMGHSFQLSRRTSPFDTGEGDGWEEELHAELLSTASLKENQKCAHSLRQRLMIRDWQLLSSDSSHLIAPSLKALLDGNAPIPKKCAVLDAVKEIRSQIGCVFIRNDPKRLARQWTRHKESGEDLWFAESYEKAYFNEHFLKFYNSAELFCTTLDWLAERRVFSAPLTQKIAEQILKSAEFFNPAYTKANIGLPRRSFPAAKIEAATPPRGERGLPRVPRARLP